MGKEKKITTKNSQKGKQNKCVTRSQSKLSEICVTSKKLNKIDNFQKLEARVTRSSSGKKVTATASKEDLELVTRITRSNQRSTIPPAQQAAPIVETKSVVKRYNFIKLNTFKKGSLVLAKQRYSIPWPSKILEIQEDKIRVFFYGDKREGFVSSSEIYDFLKSIPALKASLLTRKPQTFLTGIREIELLLKVNDTESLLNKN